LELPSGSVDEVLALGFVEHLTFFQACDTFRNVHRMLAPGGVFLFDVPDYPVWARYYLDALAGVPTPVKMKHIRKTLFGWARWPGDEHKFGWDQALLAGELADAGFVVTLGLAPFVARGIYRARFKNPDDAHLYVCATR
jgi:predicted SAM-dependent methyltransferase